MTHRYLSNASALEDLVNLADIRALDVGCGKGELVDHMNRQGAIASGLECNPLQIEAARQLDPGVPLHEGVGEDMPFDDETFDLVVFMFSLHHVPIDDQRGALAEAARVLTTGGTLYIAEPLCEGTGFEVHKPVDDETEVRAAAQRALGDVDAAVLRPVRELVYEMSYHYVSFDEFRDDMVRIDPDRRSSFERQESHMRDLFHSLGVEETRGFRFDQPVRVNVFEKP